MYTRAERAPCPHFEIENLWEFAERHGCRVVLGRTADDAPELLKELQAAGFFPIDRRCDACYQRTPSLLPRYRGSAPANWVIVNGERETGVTVHRLTDRMDAGEIYLQNKIAIGADETAGQLRRRLSVAVADTLMTFVDEVRAGYMPQGIRQDERLATVYRGMKPNDARIDAHANVQPILDLVRGTTPWPGPWIGPNGVRRKILSAARIGGADVATAITVDDRSATIAAKDGAFHYTFVAEQKPSRGPVHANS